MNAVGLGSNKARTDAISKWLGLVPGEAANASVKPSYEVPKYEVSAINAIGQGSNAARIDAIDRFRHGPAQDDTLIVEIARPFSS